tara:strand:- start:757 stop:1143 length:387 start_codon:yes stop_codon:yes gene_type:complete
MIVSDPASPLAQAQAWYSTHPSIAAYMPFKLASGASFSQINVFCPCCGNTVPIQMIRGLVKPDELDLLLVSVVKCPSCESVGHFAALLGESSKEGPFMLMLDYYPMPWDPKINPSEVTKDKTLERLFF